ncbi:pentapeptide repeat-containing protein [Amycolatopsis sp. NPDC049688]|uniref:pentapeptide repeat-containing protein n=1 Tax=Amycolatopsis sp. NPDC049688 TaxID=3154733 RepID=UPI00343CE320
MTDRRLRVTSISPIPSRGLRASRLNRPQPVDPEPAVPPHQPIGLRRVGSWTGWGKAAKALTTLATIGTGAAAIAAVYITNQTLDATRRQNAVTEQGQYTDRFGRAVEQLGSDKLDIRLGGIYALELLSRDSTRDRLTVFEVLSAFVRVHVSSSSDSNACPAPEGSTDTGTPAPLPTDVRSALTVLGRRADALEPRGSRADLTGICLTAVTDLSALRLSNLDLERSNLDRQVLLNTDFRLADLSKVSLQKADLSAKGIVEIINAHPPSADRHFFDSLGGKDLGTRFDGAFLQATNLSGAKLVLAQFANAVILQAILRESDLRYASFAAVRELAGADFTGSKLDFAIFSGVNVNGADFTAASLRYADLSNADFQYANLRGADLRNADLRGAKLSGADLRGADLRGAEMDGADLTGADLTNSKR